MNESKSGKVETQNKSYESAKCQYCATYAKTSEEVEEKLGFKGNRDRYRRCKDVWISCVYGKKNIQEKQREYKGKRYEQSKENINAEESEKIKCYICNSLILRCSLKRHQRNTHM